MDYSVTRLLKLRVICIRGYVDELSVLGLLSLLTDICCGSNRVYGAMNFLDVR